MQTTDDAFCLHFEHAIFIKFDVLSSLFWFVMLLNGYRLEFQFRILKQRETLMLIFTVIYF
jgi:hypothetical protein